MLQKFEIRRNDESNLRNYHSQQNYCPENNFCARCLDFLLAGFLEKYTFSIFFPRRPYIIYSAVGHASVSHHYKVYWYLKVCIIITFFSCLDPWKKWLATIDFPKLIFALPGARPRPRHYPIVPFLGIFPSFEYSYNAPRKSGKFKSFQNLIGWHDDKRVGRSWSIIMAFYGTVKRFWRGHQFDMFLFGFFFS